MNGRRGWVRMGATRARLTGADGTVETRALADGRTLVTVSRTSPVPTLDVDPFAPVRYVTHAHTFGGTS